LKAILENPFGFGLEKETRGMSVEKIGETLLKERKVDLPLLVWRENSISLNFAVSF